MQGLGLAYPSTSKQRKAQKASSQTPVSSNGDSGKPICGTQETLSVTAVTGASSDQKAPALRYNQGKVPVSLVDPLAIEALAIALGWCADNKYARENWRKGLKVSECLESLERHVLAMKRGEDVDLETGLRHIDLVGCNWMFLSNQMMREDADRLDDRYFKYETQKLPQDFPRGRTDYVKKA